MTVAVPDFGSLAAQQNTANNQATNLTNQANRPDQYGALGSSTWNVDGSGNWTNSTQLSGQAQGLFDSTMSGQQALTGQLGSGLDYSSLGAMPQVGGYNQQVINAWNALQAPGLQKQADASRQRLAAQGITNGSTISNNNEGLIGQNWNDASNKAILAGYQQGNTEYGQALAGRQEGAAELQNKYNAALQGSSALTSIRNSLNPNDWMAKTPASAAYIPQTIYGAAQDTFNANMMNQNADTAAKQANQSTAVNAGRAILGNSGICGLFGSGGIGNAFSGIGNAASGLWNWGTNQYNNLTDPNGWNSWNSGGNAGVMSGGMGD